MANKDFESLLAVIQQINGQIETLSSRITDLQKRATAGDLGTDQIAKLNVQIERLRANLTEKTTTRNALVSKRDTDIATQGFESLSKTIDTIERKLAAMKGALKDTLALPESHGWNNPQNISFYETNIKKLETALASFQSRMNKQFTALGTRKTGQEPTDFGTVNLTERLKGVGAQSPRELGRQAALKAIDDIQNQILQGAIDARLNAAAAAKRPVSAGLARAVDVFLGKNAPVATTPTAGGVIHEIPGGYGTQQEQIINKEIQSVQAKLAADLRVREAENSYADMLMKEIAKTSNATGGFDFHEAKFRQDFRYTSGKQGAGNPYSDFNFGDAGKANRSQQAAAEEEEALRSVRDRLQAEKRYADVLKIAAERGFAAEDLKFARSKGTAGIEEFRFAKRDQYGVNQQLDLFNAPSGKTTAGISNQFRTFGQGVVRDIGELTKWTIALGLIYGPMRKLQELTQIMIDNQTKLAEATISVSSAFVDQNKIFDIAADSANQAGESISGVIDAFTQAYRATGGAGDQVQRLATAQKLLNDSLILSKLSTLDQAEAIDTLSAALRQTGGNLNNGTELLDKWVRVTKIANVDMASLATGFAVLGDAAEAAGIGTDDLNGILAALAETGVASGRELANTARAIVAGFQSDQSKQALENIGIAVTDTTGKMRPFLDIMKQLSDLRRSGVIDDTTFSKLTLALGGGTRRQAAYATFIENFSRVGQVSAESARASGDAQAALAKQLETVQTSLTRLGNAFQELAQSLGTEGGFLGIITKGVDTMTSLVKVFDALTSSLGKATPALAAFIAASLVLKQRGEGGIQQALFGVGQGIATGQEPELVRLARYTGNRNLGGEFRQSAATNIFGTNAASGIFQGIAASIIPAFLNLMNKEDKYGGTKAAADVVGGITGGIIGSLVAGSPIVGGAIGTAIADAFISTTVGRKTDIFGYGPAGFAKPGQPAKTPAEDLDKRLTDAESQLYKVIGGGNEGLGKLLTTPNKTTENIYENINKAIQNRDDKEFNRLVSHYGEVFFQRTSGLTIAQVRQAFAANTQIQFNPQTIARQLALTRPGGLAAVSEYDAARAARTAKGDIAGEVTPFSKLVAQNNDIYKSLLESIKESSKRTLSQERVAGEVKGAEYGRKFEAIGGFSEKAVLYYTALGDKVNGLSNGTKDAAKQFDILNNVIVNGADEAIPQITSLSGEITNIVNLLSDPNAKDELFKQFPKGAEEAQKKLEELRGTLLAVIKDVNDQTLLKNFKFPEIVGDYTQPRSREDTQKIYERGVKIQEDYLNSTGATRDQIEAFKKSIEDFKTPIKDAGSVVFDTISGLEQRFYSLAEASLTAEGALKSLQNFDIQKLDITSQQGAGLQGQIDYFSKYLAKNFPQYQQKPEQFGVIFSDYVTSVLHGDNLAVKLALEKLVDINQKQLDGMYNIPEGATFWVPLTAAYYRPKNEAGAGGMGGLPSVGDTQAVTSNTAATDRNTAALLNLNTNPWLRSQSVSDTAMSERDRKTAASLNLNTNPWLRAGGTAMNTEDYAGRHPGATGLPRLNTGTPFENFRQGPRQGGFGTTLPQAPVVNAKIEMRIDNKTQLMVDGRILASVIAPYLSSDLLKLEASQGTIVKKYVI